MLREILSVRSAARRQAVDVTDEVNRILKEGGAADGLCSLFVQHTTAALAVGEVGEGTEDDLLETLDKLLPKLRWRHRHDPSHAPDHMLGSLLGPSLMLPVARGKLNLGTWQRALLIELNGPRERSIVVTAAA